MTGPSYLQRGRHSRPGSSLDAGQLRLAMQRRLAVTKCLNWEPMTLPSVWVSLSTTYLSPSLRIACKVGSASDVFRVVMKFEVASYAEYDEGTNCIKYAEERPLIVELEMVHVRRDSNRSRVRAKWCTYGLFRRKRVVGSWCIQTLLKQKFSQAGFKELSRCS